MKNKHLLYENTVTEEQLIEATYEVARKVYYSKTWSNTNYTVDDFEQDAVMHILDLYHKNYFEVEDSQNIKGLIYTLLSNHFVKNTYKSVKRDQQNLSLQDVGSEESDMSGVVGKTFYNRQGSDIEDPSEIVASEESILLGKYIIEDVIKKLNFLPPVSRSHSYKGREKTLGAINLSERNIAKLLLLGYNLHEIYEIYGQKTLSGATGFISRLVKSVMEDLKEYIDLLDEIEKKAVTDYIMSIDRQQDSLRAVSFADRKKAKRQ